jgi:hypothetical protein
MLSFLSSINRIINSLGVHRPRHKYGLWLVPDQTVRDATAKELESEPLKIELMDRRPSINIAGGFSDLLRGPMGASLTVACTHNTWMTDGNDREVSEIIEMLALYDFIVFDEVDWANDRVRRAADLARHAVKYSLTASPPIQNGQVDPAFRKRFVLVRNEVERDEMSGDIVAVKDCAVADYTRARDVDRCLKYYSEPVIAAKHPAHDFLLEGIQREQEGNMPPTHALYLAAVLQAVQDADDDETKLKQEVGDAYFSGHVLVAMPTIRSIEVLKPILENKINDLLMTGMLKNEGWGVTAVYSGHQMAPWCRNLPDEKDLTGITDTGQFRHPFMVAKNNYGRATSRSKRICLICKIFDRGLNNWPINRVVDCTRDTSFTRNVQLVLGRMSRWPSKPTREGPPDRSTWLDRDDLRWAATATVYVPSSLTVIEDGVTPNGKMEALDDALEFVEDTLEIVACAGFLTWSDLMNGKTTTDGIPGIDPDARPLSPAEKYRIQAALAAAASGARTTKEGVSDHDGWPPFSNPDEDSYISVDAPLQPEPAPGGVLNVEDIITIVRPLFPGFGGKQTTKAVDYAVNLATKLGYRKDEMLATHKREKYRRASVRVGERLHTEQVIDSNDLIQFLQGKMAYRGKWERYAMRIRVGDEDFIELVSDQYREQQRRMYMPPARMYQLNGTPKEPGVLRLLANELSRDLYKAGIHPSDKGVVPAMVSVAACELFGLAHARKGGPMDKPAYHIAILDEYKQDIIDMARGRLTGKGHLGTDMARFANEGEDEGPEVVGEDAGEDVGEDTGEEI